MQVCIIFLFSPASGGLGLVKKMRGSCNACRFKEAWVISEDVLILSCLFFFVGMASLQISFMFLVAFGSVLLFCVCDDFVLALSGCGLFG